MISYIDDRNEWRSGRDLILRDWVVTSRTSSVRRRVILFVNSGFSGGESSREETHEENIIASSASSERTTTEVKMEAYRLATPLTA
jgi:hypothetical protein